MAFDNSGTKAVSSAWLGTTQKGANYHFSLPHLDEPHIVAKALDLGSLNMQFQQDGPEDKKLHLFKVFG